MIPLEKICYPSKNSRSFLAIFLVALLVAIAVAGYLYGAKFHGNITGFFRIGSELPLSPLLNPEQTLIYQGELGYDGQQFLTIALDPGLHNPDSIAALDHPSYRYRRILYPLLGYLLGGGNPALIPWALVGLNTLAIAVCTTLVAVYLGERGHPVNSALGLLAIPGIWMVLSLATADLLASGFGLGAIICQQQKKWWLMAFLLALGLLTRETLLIIWLAILLTAIQHRQWRSVAMLSLSPLPLAAWLGYIRWRQLPGGSGTGNFGFPLVGIGEKFQSLLQTGFTSGNLYEAYLWLLLWLTLGLLIWLTWPRGKVQTLFNAGLLYLGLLLVASFYILNYYLNYNRVFLDVFIFSLMVIAPTQRRLMEASLGGWGLASLLFLLLQS